MNKHKIGTIVLFLSLTLLTSCLIVFIASACTKKSKLAENKIDVSAGKIDSRREFSAAENLKCISLDFIKTDNSETKVSAYISLGGFAAIPLQYFTNLKEIAWRENGKEIVIDSGAYWTPGNPFVLLKIPYENQSFMEIVKWLPAKPLLWKNENTEIQLPAVKQSSNTFERGDSVEIDISDKSRSGLLIQDDHIVGWTFSFLRDKGYLWAGVSEKDLNPNIELNLLSALLDENSRNELEMRQIKDVSVFYINSRPSKEWNPVIISMISKTCADELTEQNYENILTIITPALLLKSCNTELLDFYIKANDALYGKETVVSLLGKLQEETPVPDALFNDIISLKIRDLKSLIKNLKEAERKIVIKYSPNAQRNIFLDTVINKEVSQRFILDTGSSMVSIPLLTASKLGIDLTDENYATRIIATASGVFKTKEVILHSITINGKDVYDVPAIVIDLPQDKSLGLLGMNFLSKFQMELNDEKGEISLTPKEQIQ